MAVKPKCKLLPSDGRKPKLQSWGLKTKMAKEFIKIGQKFDRLTVLNECEPFLQPSGQKNRAFNCVCDCGKEKKVRMIHLRLSRVRSCGCIVGENHRMCSSRLYSVWRGMLSRCKSKGRDAHIYRERGIKVCQEWEGSFSAFKLWAENNGYADHLTIDREDNEKGYHPDNCRFVAQKVNNYNRRISMKVEYDGKIKVFAEIIENKKLGAYTETIRRRIYRGWSAQRAFDTPIKQGNYITREIRAKLKIERKRFK